MQSQRTTKAHYKLSVPWFRRLVASLSPRIRGLAPWSVHVGFVVDKVQLRPDFLRAFRFSPVNIIPPWLRTHTSRDKQGSLIAAVQRHSLAPST
jgi:hypothetical protein